ncbi:E3 ubiquitin-protein ligase sina-like [Zootermopsis nevadensis]|uniref:E3 ubiquitin-protein ligase sina-like n=1 Tax=Zootermopsis nevadensis TaxID=136037 RepID=UPI000B8E360D|nr:E3 ubiquitin-protein ligase sina-like [Zootermopsis nevadensis]
MSDDKTSPFEGPQVTESLQNVLECPVCLEYMVPPITMCASGHSVCQACKPRLHGCPTCRRPLLGIRNFALESLASSLELPLCIAGTHPLPQPTEPEYGCPLECQWTGLRGEIWRHVSQTHREKILEGRGNNCRWELPLVVKDTRAIFAFGEVFLYRQRLHTIKKLFYVVVQYIGPIEDASKYKYEVEFCSSSGDQKVRVMGNITLGLYEDINAVYESGNCVTLDYDVVKNMAEGSQLTRIEMNELTLATDKFSTSTMSGIQ